ncbi:MAG: GtrA family protein [Ruminococcaceae bacterium]|nr:GtrA family protein [Oscillospiraceae bacterium]
MKDKKITDNILQFIKFGIVGVINNVIYMIGYYAVIFINSSWYLLGGFAGWFISVLNSYFLNNRFVFKNDANSLKEQLKKLGKTYISYGATFIVTQILLVCEIELFSVSEVIAPIINIFITIPFNFLLNKFWTFKK